MSSIKVAVRCRPLFEQERPATGLDFQGRRILLDSKTYDPDYTFPPTSSQEDLFAACRPILQCVKDGLNGTLMVYGQTGTGKTHTMLGVDGQDDGLVHKVIAHMLDHVQQKTLEGAQCALTLSMIEIYNERLTDMLSEDGLQEVTLIAGFPRTATKVTLARLADAKEAVRRGLAYRHTAVTMMNARSSRSHVVFIVDLEEFNAFTNETDVAHLFMVDLAGSESIKKSQATGTTAEEAGKINKSLLALKSVFLALSNTNEATRPPHVPYRDSRLTELLQDSIGGTARTLMIACISSVGRDIEETKSTLMYAVKARSIRNATNSEKEKLLIRLRSMEVENQRLRNRLQERVSERGGYYVTKEDHERYEAMEAESKELRESVEQLVKVAQANDARKHISESQTKLLQGMVADKEDELQAFKGMYSEALHRFERNAATLQRIVQAAVTGVKRAAQVTAVQRHQQLAAWRSHLLTLLEAAPTDAPTAALDGARDELLEPSAPPSARHTPPLPPPPLSPSTASIGTSPQKARQELWVPATASLHASPAKRGGRGGGSGNFSRHSVGGFARTAAAGGAVAHRRQQPLSVREGGVARSVEDGAASAAASPLLTPASPDGVGPVTAPSQDVAPSSPALTFLAEADTACRRIVDRVNQSVAALLTETISAQARCEEAVQAAEAAREAATTDACDTLRDSVEQCISRLHRIGCRAKEESAAARSEYGGRLRVLAATAGAGNEEDARVSGGEGVGVHRGICEARPLQYVVREACLAAVRSAEVAFPPPEAPEEVRRGLEAVVTTYQGRLGELYATGLQPLASYAAPDDIFAQQLQASVRQHAEAQAAAEAMGAEVTDDALTLADPPYTQESPVPCGSQLPQLPAPARAGGGVGVGGPTAGSPPSSVASTLAASSPVGLPLPPRGAHAARALSLTSAPPPARATAVAGRGSRATTGARGSAPAPGSASARGSLRVQQGSSANVSPRPAKKRTRSSLALSSLSGRPQASAAGSPNAGSGRRAPASRTEQ